MPDYDLYKLFFVMPAYDLFRLFYVMEAYNCVQTRIHLAANANVVSPQGGRLSAVFKIEWLFKNIRSTGLSSSLTVVLFYVCLSCLKAGLVCKR